MMIYASFLFNEELLFKYKKADCFFLLFYLKYYLISDKHKVFYRPLKVEILFINHELFVNILIISFMSF